MDAQLEGHGIKLEYGQLVKEIQGNGKVEKIIKSPIFLQELFLK